MRTVLWATCILAAAMAGPAEVEIPEDPPVATRPAAGAVTGKITPAGKVARLEAVSRATGERYSPQTFDRTSGGFAFRDLPGDAAYDIAIVTADGERIEGIDLSWFEARLLRLAELRRKDLGLPVPPTHAFTGADARELLSYVRDLKDFADIRRVLYVRGDGPRAVMLVEVMRARDFHARKGDEVIWRIELWYFRYSYGGWERVGNVERVLERHRIPAGEWRKITLVYYPELSAYVDESGRSQPVEFVIPDRLDPNRGRLAGTDPVQKTEPIILLPPKPQPASRPRRDTRGDSPGEGRGAAPVESRGGSPQVGRGGSPEPPR